MKKTFIITSICIILISLVYLQCKSNKPSDDPRGSLYAGSVTCIKCHSDIYHSYLHTAHYLASLPATDSSVHGSFAKNANVFYFDASRKIVMEKSDSGMFQTYYQDGKVVESHRFDIVLGGVKGESYLYWNGNGLDQLPISYFSIQHEWLLSPRYAPGFVDFNRTITARCMECHASYITDQANATNGLTVAEQFDKNSLVFSIDCERCHGPAAAHVAFQTENPGIKTAKYIVSYSSLPRARRMDMCGVCHSGNNSPMLLSTFAFKPGDTLAKFKLPDLFNAVDTSRLDVHGNQVQLLESSKCFINSKMDCATCHDPHRNERDNLAFYTEKCLNCHSTVKHNYCKMANKLDATLIKSDCINCHMPALASRVIITPAFMKTSSVDIAVHTHHIAIYPQEVKKILAYVDK